MSTFYSKPREAGVVDKNTDIEAFLTMHANALGRLGNTATSLSKHNKAIEPYASALVNASVRAEGIGHKFANALPFGEEAEVPAVKGMT